MTKRILAVDDEPRILAVIQQRLESAGYEVITARDGLEALTRARSEKPDLIVLDLILPKLNGYEVCNMLKRDRQYRDIPILMLTARTQTKDVEEGIRVGADGYMTKPDRPELFLERGAQLIPTPEKLEQIRLARAQEAEQARKTTRPQRITRLLK